MNVSAFRYSSKPLRGHPGLMSAADARIAISSTYPFTSNALLEDFRFSQVYFGEKKLLSLCPNSFFLYLFLVSLPPLSLSLSFSFASRSLEDQNLLNYSYPFHSISCHYSPHPDSHFFFFKSAPSLVLIPVPMTN